MNNRILITGELIKAAFDNLIGFTLINKGIIGNAGKCLIGYLEPTIKTVIRNGQFSKDEMKESALSVADKAIAATIRQYQDRGSELGFDSNELEKIVEEESIYDISLAQVISLIHNI